MLRREAVADRPHEDGWVPQIRQFPRGFVMPAQLQETAWRSASETGALVHIDYDVVLALSRVYEEQGRYESQTRPVSQLIYGQLFAGGKPEILNNYRNLGEIIGTFYYREQQLVALYGEVLLSLQSKP